MTNEEFEVLRPADEIVPEPEEESTEALRKQIEDVLDDEPAPAQISGRCPRRFPRQRYAELIKEDDQND